jgi:hypothetical protein
VSFAKAVVGVLALIFDEWQISIKHKVLVCWPGKTAGHT